ncbi:MAG: hypothetical protein KKA90_02590 [Nanoarchaeota archaeon]|nr:hypothetical protein [Nanoarchaeota archaeon]
MAKSKPSVKEVIKKIEHDPQLQRLPPAARRLIKAQLESAMTVPFPVITFKEAGWVVASTPVIDVCAQGKTEEEAIESLKGMIDDYMTDPDTKKPEIRQIVNMQVGIKTVPFKLPLNQGESHTRKNPPVTA